MLPSTTDSWRIRSVHENLSSPNLRARQCSGSRPRPDERLGSVVAVRPTRIRKIGLSVHRLRPSISYAAPGVHSRAQSPPGRNRPKTAEDFERKEEREPRKLHTAGFDSLFVLLSSLFGFLAGHWSEVPGSRRPVPSLPGDQGGSGRDDDRSSQQPVHILQFGGDVDLLGAGRQAVAAADARTCRSASRRRIRFAPGRGRDNRGHTARTGRCPKSRCVRGNW